MSSRSGKEDEAFGVLRHVVLGISSRSFAAGSWVYESRVQEKRCG